MPAHRKSALDGGQRASAMPDLPMQERLQTLCPSSDGREPVRDARGRSLWIPTNAAVYPARAVKFGPTQLIDDQREPTV